ncbi:MAG: SIS domain-containing protein [Candidatus Sigynarchaeota archaeon]
MQNISNYTWDQLKTEFSFVSDMFAQPGAIESFVNFYTGADGKAMLLGFKEEWDNTAYTSVIVTGMGSSLFAAHQAEMAFQQAGVPCNVIDAGELLYYALSGGSKSDNRDRRKILYILISQSGESAEIAKIVGIIAEQYPDAGLWGITNTASSTLAKKAKRTAYLHAGTELSVTTKTFSNTLLLMYLLPRVLLSPSNADAAACIDDFAREARDLVKDLDHLFSEQSGLGDRMVAFMGKDVRQIEIIARGTSLATAQQAALNIKETNKIPAEAITGGQFRHGPIEIVNKDFRCFVLTSDDSTRALAEDIAWNITHKWGGGKAIFVTNKRVANFEGESRLLPVVHGITNPYLAPVMEIAIIQLFMARLAASCNIGPGVFKYTSKITKEG